MITEDYISFETAKLLKEKGFDDIDCECHGWIGRSGKHYSADDTYYDDKELKEAQEDRKDYIPLITLQMAMKWLRKIHNIYIDIAPTHSPNEPIHFIWQTYNSDYLVTGDCDIFYLTYEKACEAALKYCLEDLI